MIEDIISARTGNRETIKLKAAANSHERIYSAASWIKESKVPKSADIATVDKPQYNGLCRADAMTCCDFCGHSRRQAATSL